MRGRRVCAAGEGRRNMKRKKIRWIVPAALVLVLALLCGGFAALAVRYGPRFGFYLLPPDAPGYGEAALSLIDEFGLYSQGDEWNACLAECRAAAETAESYDECRDILRRALAVGGGKHSFLLSPDEAAAAAAGDAAMPVTYMDGDIAVVALPPFMGGEEQGAAYTGTVQRFLHENREKLHGVLLGLRGNTGGDCGPMIAAAAPLLPDGTLVSYQYAGYELPVTLEGGALTNAGSGGTVLYPDEKLAVPVAILTDERTASSAELLLLCFRGLDDTRSFGAPTAGYCSVNQCFRLYDGTQMYLTVAADRARTGEVFESEPIGPDETAASPESAALAWLKSR